MVHPLRIIAIMSLFSFLTTSCSAGWKTIREGTHAGMPYAVQERNKTGMFASTNSFEWRIKVGRMKPVNINASATDWGPSYSTDIFGADSYLFFDTVGHGYSNVPFVPGTIGVAHTMLYVSPSVINEQQFEQFWNFMKAEWPALSQTLAGNSLRDFPHIIGLVYGLQNKYTKTFKGTHDSRAMLLRVENDGRVRLMSDDSYRSEYYSGFARMVQMPGKRLLFDTTRTNGGLTMAELSQFKDERGIAVKAHFQIELRDLVSEEEKARMATTMLSHKWCPTPQITDGERRPPEKSNHGTYLLLSQGGIAEEADGSSVKPGDWSYDALTHTLTVRSEKERTVYIVKSIKDNELVLEYTNETISRVAIVFQRVD